MTKEEHFIQGCAFLKISSFLSFGKLKEPGAKFTELSSSA